MSLILGKKMNVAGTMTGRFKSLVGNVTEVKQNHVWHIRTQLWAFGGRRRRVSHRVVADSSKHAVDKLMLRLKRVRGQVVTRIVEGKAVA